MSFNKFYNDNLKAIYIDLQKDFGIPKSITAKDFSWWESIEQETAKDIYWHLFSNWYQDLWSKKHFGIGVSLPKTNGYVYIIETDNYLYKIGVSINPEERVNQLQTSSPSQLSLSHVIACDVPKQAEMILHSHFNEFRLIGEWFSLFPWQIESLKSMRFYKEHNFYSDSMFSPLMKFQDNPNMLYRLLRETKKRMGYL